jgi:NTE family protein
MKIGLACAGGGIEGAVYEIGALCALEEAIDGLDFCDVHVYVGVSAGAFVTSCLANGITPRNMSLAILSQQTSVHPITPGTFFTPAFGEYFARAGKIPSLLASMTWEHFTKPGDISIGGSLARLTELLPVGLFDNSPIKNYLEKNFENFSRTNDFRELNSKLRIVATDLDSSKSVVFGKNGVDDVPISLAVQASTALPVVYMPVRINGRYYIDGVAQRTVHASVALEEGADLVICVNPIVPFEAIEHEELDDKLKDVLVERGLPAVLSQTFRTMIHSRMKVGINRYKQEFLGREIIVFEPAPTDYRMFFTNIFSFSSRQDVCEYAYQSTRKNLLLRAAEIEPILKKSGLQLRTDVLKNPTKSLYDPQFQPNGYTATRKLGNTLQELELLLDRM